MPPLSGTVAFRKLQRIKWEFSRAALLELLERSSKNLKIKSHQFSSRINYSADRVDEGMCIR